MIDNELLEQVKQEVTAKFGDEAFVILSIGLKSHDGTYSLTVARESSIVINGTRCQGFAAAVEHLRKVMKVTNISIPMGRPACSCSLEGENFVSPPTKETVLAMANELFVEKCRLAYHSHSYGASIEARARESMQETIQAYAAWGWDVSHHFPSATP